MGRGSGLTVTRAKRPDGMWGSVDVHVAAHQFPMSEFVKDAQLSSECCKCEEGSVFVTAGLKLTKVIGFV